MKHHWQLTRTHATVSFSDEKRFVVNTCFCKRNAATRNGHLVSYAIFICPGGAINGVPFQGASGACNEKVFITHGECACMSKGRQCRNVVPVFANGGMSSKHMGMFLNLDGTWLVLHEFGNAGCILGHAVITLQCKTVYGSWG